MIKLGDYNRLKIVRRAEHGLYLEGDERTGDILLPGRYVTRDMRLNQEVDVFVYLDQDERIVATTEQAAARVGEFACLEVAWTNKYGAFLKWGLMKDLFCPFSEQKQHMEIGHHYVVYVKEDEMTHRLMATAKVERALHEIEEATPQKAALKHGDEVSCMVWKRTDLGYKVIVDNCRQGQVYENQVFQPLSVGMKLTGYVDHVRQDGRIDITLQRTGYQHTLDLAEVVLRYLHENGGRCTLSDKSDAELIYDRFKVSKKAYKKAIGDLYRRRLIVITDEGIELV